MLRKDSCATIKRHEHGADSASHATEERHPDPLLAAAFIPWVASALVASDVEARSDHAL